MEKVYRKDCLDNEKYPQQPPEGWIPPDAIFTRLNDVVRGRIVCKYKDGPEFLANFLREHAIAYPTTLEYGTRQHDTGYYAHHIYISVPFTRITNAGTEVEGFVKVEIQLSTQLQEILYDLTHPLYERRRLRINENSSAWKWALDSKEFRAGYIGHTLHFLEAVILDLRSQPSESNSSLGESSSDANI